MNEFHADDKHAFLIMAHHRPDLLQLLVSALDDTGNDLYIHIDQKADSSDWNISAQKSKLTFLDSMSVNWAGYSQVECEYRLLKAAVADGRHLYYHMLTGASFPLMNSKKLHDFFAENAGKEFVGFDNKKDFSSRVKYYYLFSERGKLHGISGRILGKIRSGYLALQKVLRVDHFKKYGLICKKGIAYWSITQECAEYVIQNEALMKSVLKKSVSGDEVFVQTLVYNSPHFRSRIYSMEDEYEGAMVEMAWEKYGDRPGHDFAKCDLEKLLSCNKCFALKFEGPDGLWLIEELRKKLVI